MRRQGQYLYQYAVYSIANKSCGKKQNMLLFLQLYKAITFVNTISLQKFFNWRYRDMSQVRLLKSELAYQMSRYGYFAEQFPDCFSSKSFSENVDELLTLAPCSRNKTRASNKHSTSPSTLSMYKNDISRRVLSVPNPEAFLRLTNFMQQHWSQIKYSSKSKHSLSPITSIRNYPEDPEEFLNCESVREALHVKSDFINGIKQCIRASIGYKYRLNIDISNFYNSIYTHSITWAVCGKKDAKRYFRSKEPSELKDLYEFADSLDCFTRFLKNNETNGIVVGPYTSRIVSELILSRIDKNLSEKGFIFKRYVDDYKMYFRSEEQALESLPIIEKILNEYNLALNTSKTSVQRYPYEVISQMQDIFNSAFNKDGIFGVLNSAAQLHLSGEKGAYKYALKYIRNEPIPHEDLQIIIPTLTNTMLIDPKYGKYVTQYLKANLESIKKETLTVIFNEELRSSLNNELQQESLLFVQIIRDLDLTIDADNIISILKSDNDFATIIALDLWKYRNHSVNRNRAQAHKINTTISEFATSLKGEQFSGSRWLLLYEIIMHRLVPNDLMPTPDINDFFKKMMDLKVCFYSSVKEDY